MLDKNTNITVQLRLRLPTIVRIVTAGADLVEADIPALSQVRLHRQHLQDLLQILKENNLGIIKVDKVAGKGLSTEDYTSAEKPKLIGIEAGAE